LIGTSERFECFVAKKEIANAYTEMNNSFSQIGMLHRSALAKLLTARRNVHGASKAKGRG
jgi:lysyl-tRNA synthetase class II